MNRFILSIFLGLSIQFTSAQDYIPLPDSGAIWTNVYHLADLNIYEFHHADYFCTDGSDTLISGNTYVQLLHCEAGYKGAFRDNGGQVFYVAADSTQEYLLYDFTAEAGDTLLNVYFEVWEDPWLTSDLVVSYIDSIFINGDYRRRVNFNSNYPWIEGIGNPQGLLVEPWQNVSGYLVELFCMSHLGITLYPNESSQPCSFTVGLPEEEINSKFQIYPNPTSGSISIDFADQMNETTLIIHNALGQEIQNVSIPNGDQNFHLTIDGKPGIYFLSITQKDNSIQRFKVLKN